VLMGVQDNMMVGTLGSETLSAATLANSIYFILAIIPIGGTLAISALISEADGANDDSLASNYFKKGLWVSMLLTIFSIISTIFCTVFMHEMGQPANEVALAIPFLIVLNISTIPLILFFHYKNFLDGLSHTQPGMYITLIGLGMNILLNWIFIHGNFGAPVWGLFGAGFATLLSRIGMFLMIFVYIHKTKVYQKYLQLNSYSFDIQFFKKISTIAFPLGFQYFFEVAAFAGTAIMIGWMENPATARSAHQIAMNIASLSFMFYLGLSTAASIRVGNFLGLSDKKGITNAALSGVLLMVLALAFSTACILIFKEQIAGWYGMTDPEINKIVVSLLWLALTFQAFDGIQVLSTSILRGLQDVTFSLVLTFVSYWIICLPLSYWLSFHCGFWVYGVWWAFIFSLGVVAIFASLRCVWAIRKLQLRV
jgi:multidrug resistance protein, MATE family